MAIGKAEENKSMKKTQNQLHKRIIKIRRDGKLILEIGRTYKPKKKGKVRKRRRIQFSLLNNRFNSLTNERFISTNESFFFSQTLSLLCTHFTCGK